MQEGKNFWFYCVHVLVFLISKIFMLKEVGLVIVFYSANCLKNK